MTMPPLPQIPQDSRAPFAALRELAAQLAAGWAGGTPSTALDGHIQDYAVAVEEGATVVRLGSVLYGPPTRGRLAAMGVRDLWHRTLVYFGLAEDESLYDDATRTAPPRTRIWSVTTASGRTCAGSTGNAGRAQSFDEIYANGRRARERVAPPSPLRAPGAATTARGPTAVPRPTRDRRHGAGDHRRARPLIAPRSFNDAQQIADRFKRACR